MMNDVELVKEHKFADNDFRAAAICTGLKLWECKTDDEKLARVRLYRDWRNSKIYGKNTAPCFEAAIKGEPVPMTMMVMPCGHSINAVIQSDEGTAFCGSCADDSLRANIAAGVEA